MYTFLLICTQSYPSHLDYTVNRITSTKVSSYLAIDKLWQRVTLQNPSYHILHWKAFHEHVVRKQPHLVLTLTNRQQSDSGHRATKGQRRSLDNSMNWVDACLTFSCCIMISGGVSYSLLRGTFSLHVIWHWLFVRMPEVQLKGCDSKALV